MKRYGNIFDKVIDKENLKLAILKASLGKRKRKSVKKILDNMDYYVEDLRTMLLYNRYIPSEYKTKTINDGISKKKREISCPKFYPDQCVQWALMLQLEPIFNKRLYYYSCASIKGGGVHKVLRYVKRITRNDKKNTKWVLQLDIKKFYPSIDKEILKFKIRKIIKDYYVLHLLDLIIDSSPRGVPIGNYTSQWFANLYLNELDNFIKQVLKIKYYVRYMDDMVLFSSNKKQLHNAKKKYRRFCTKRKIEFKK